MQNRMEGRAIAVDVGILLGGFGFRLATQIGWFIMAVRCLGPEGYGAFVSVTALTIILSSFVGWGCGALLIRDVGADPSVLRARFGHGIMMIGGTGLGFGVAILLVLPLLEFARIGTGSLVAILVADLILGRLVEFCISVNVAVGKAGRQSLFMAVAGCARLIAVMIAAGVTPHLTLGTWAAWYCGAGAIAAVFSLGLTVQDIGMPVWRLFPDPLRTGFSFSAEHALQASLKDLDKPIVAVALGAEAAGFYAAAIRLVETTLMPIHALGYATYGRFFSLAAQGHAKSIALGLRLLPAGVGYGLGVGLVLLLGADLVPWLFGERYGSVPPLVRLLALLPLFTAVFVLGADVLTSLGFQTQRLLLVGLSLAATIGLCALLVPALGADGAAISRSAVQALAAAGVWWLVLVRGRPSAEPTEPSVVAAPPRDRYR